MIASLRGTLSERLAGACVVDCAGVGYLVQVSSQTQAALPAAGEPVALRTRQIVREDSVQLFGFSDAEELRLFDLLITVSGVGPKVALAVLSGLKPAALGRAIREEQIGALVAVPGIGRKTAERLIVELRDKLEASAAPPREGGVLPKSERYDDAVAALVNLGYTPAQAQDAVRRVVGEHGSEQTVETLVKRALGRLARPAVTTAHGRTS